jgi:Putative prokaryotic signal transducing protein
VQHWGVALTHRAILTAIEDESNCLGMRDFSDCVTPSGVACGRMGVESEDWKFGIAEQAPAPEEPMEKSTATGPNPNEKLVRVFDTEQESEALVVRGLLEAAGIDADMTSLDAQQDILPGVGGTIILVREEDAEAARKVIQEYRRAPSDETAEIEITEDPADER